MKKIGLIGGTFDPVHLGHISLALFAQKNYKLDKIYFIPTSKSLLKPNTTSYSHRFNMLNLSIRNYPQFKVSRWEKNGDGLFSNTLTKLKKLNTNSCQFYFIFGSDTCSQINKWKNYKQIQNLAKIISVDRDNLSPISSTTIRSNIKFDHSITGLLPGIVESYILEQNLYK